VPRVGIDGFSLGHKILAVGKGEGERNLFWSLVRVGPKEALLSTKKELCNEAFFAPQIPTPRMALYSEGNRYMYCILGHENDAPRPEKTYPWDDNH